MSVQHRIGLFCFSVPQTMDAVPFWGSGLKLSFHITKLFPPLAFFLVTKLLESLLQMLSYRDFLIRSYFLILNSCTFLIPAVLPSKLISTVRILFSYCFLSVPHSDS